MDGTCLPSRRAPAHAAFLAILGNYCQPRDVAITFAIDRCLRRYHSAWMHGSSMDTKKQQDLCHGQLGCFNQMHCFQVTGLKTHMMFLTNRFRSFWVSSFLGQRVRRSTQYQQQVWSHTLRFICHTSCIQWCSQCFGARLYHFLEGNRDLSMEKDEHTIPSLF